MDWQFLIDFDKQFLLWINGSPSLFLDNLALTLTRAWTWVPLYLSLFYLVMKNSDQMQKMPPTPSALLFSFGGWCAAGC